MKYTMIFLLLLAASTVHSQNTLEEGAEYTVEITVNRAGKYKVSSFGTQTEAFDVKRISITNQLTSLLPGMSVIGIYTVKTFASAGGLGSTRSGGKGKGILVVDEMKDSSGNYSSCGSGCPAATPMEIQIK